MDPDRIRGRPSLANPSRFAKTSGPLAVGPDVRPTTNQLIARLDDGGWIVEKMRWGLVTFWRSGEPLKDTEKGKGDGFKLTTCNARCEGVASAATFKGAFARRRCVVPASAWYEWTRDKGAKAKHTFRRQDGAPIWFAGIWDQAVTPDAGEVRSFTILTGPSDGWLADYHDRAPVILDPSDFGAWMDAANDPDEVMAAMRTDRFEVAATS